MILKLLALLLPAAMMLTLTAQPARIDKDLIMGGGAGFEPRLISFFLDQLPVLTSVLLGVMILTLAHSSKVFRQVSLSTAVGSLWVAAFWLGRELGVGSIAFAEVIVAFGSLGCLLIVGIAGCLHGPVRISIDPKRVSGRRAVHGQAQWLSMADLARLFPEHGGIVVGERDRVDKSSGAGLPFRADVRSTWNRGGLAPLACFDCSFGSTHGLVFAGSGGYKTSSVTIPTALNWPSGLVVLDPSREVLPIVQRCRARMGRMVIGLDPQFPEIGFNALDWIGRFGGTAEQDIVAVANWIIPQTGRAESIRDDFFRGTAVQLLTALIADVCLSGHTLPERRTLRQVRANLAEPEPQLRGRLQAIYDNSASTFVRENVAPFINMTPETFSGVYASAAKETHWLSYDNYAALVSGTAISTDQLAEGNTDIFINLDLQTLESHPGLARVAVGALTNAIFNRRGRVKGRTLFLIDEAARLGYMKILEVARDAGRKYGITLVLLFQSLGQMRETYGGRDAASKWFESASWISFAAINDLETAEYISRRCGDTTVEVSQVTISGGGGKRSRSRQLVRRALILPNEVMAMRSDEQIVFTAGSAPIRTGRAIYFRRRDMLAQADTNPFQSGGGQSLA